MCEVGRGLFLLGVARRGRWEYSLHAKASPCQTEVKNERVERFACESFYVLSCFYLLFLFLMLILSSFSYHLRGPRFRVQTPFLSHGNNILHIFILHAKVTEMGVTPSSQN